jgi:hypothetical protein
LAHLRCRLPRLLIAAHQKAVQGNTFRRTCSRQCGYSSEGDPAPSPSHGPLAELLGPIGTAGSVGFGRRPTMNANSASRPPLQPGRRWLGQAVLPRSGHDLNAHDPAAHRRLLCVHKGAQPAGHHPDGAGRSSSRCTVRLGCARWISRAASLPASAHHGRLRWRDCAPHPANQDLQLPEGTRRPGRQSAGAD